MIPFSRLEWWFRVLLVLWRVVSERETTLDSGPGRGVHCVWIPGWGCEKPVKVNVARPACLSKAVERFPSLFDRLHVQPLFLSFNGGLSPCFVGFWIVQLVYGLV